MTDNCELIGCGQEGFEHIELVLDVPTLWGGATTKVEMFVCPSCRNKIWDPNAYIGQSRAQVKGVISQRSKWLKIPKPGVRKEQNHD